MDAVSGAEVLRVLLNMNLEWIEIYSEDMRIADVKSFMTLETVM